jgi:hypothetical protein
MVVLDLINLGGARPGEEPQIAVELDLLHHHRAAAQRAVGLGRCQHRNLYAPDQFIEPLDRFSAVCGSAHLSDSFVCGSKCRLLT